MHWIAPTENNTATSPAEVGRTTPCTPPASTSKAEVGLTFQPKQPLTERTRIVAEVERPLSVVVELEAVVSADLQRAVRLRLSVLQRAFTAQLCTGCSAFPIARVLHSILEGVAARGYCIRENVYE